MASMARIISNFGLTANSSTGSATCSSCGIFFRNASWSRLFRGSEPTEKTPEHEEEATSQRKKTKWDGFSTESRLGALKKQVCLNSIRGYDPPLNLEARIIKLASEVAGCSVGLGYRLDDRLLKFKLLTKVMADFDHPIPNQELSLMNTVGDLVTFFSIPVKDRSSLENMSRLNLPKNLHIQLEPVRFDPETDTFFDGQTAFPGRPTIVSSLKFSRKYKGNSGQSRNQRSQTEYEYKQQLEADYGKLGLKMYGRFNK